MISLPLISHQDNTSCDTMCFQVAHGYMPWQQLHQEPICMAIYPTWMSAWHMFPCPPRLFSMCHLTVNPIWFPNVPYDAPTVLTYHPHSIFNFIPYIWFTTHTFLMAFTHFPSVIHICSWILSQYFLSDTFLMMFPQFPMATSVLQSCPPVWFATCSLWCSPSSHSSSTFVL